MTIWEFILINISTLFLVFNQVILKFWIKRNNAIIWPLNVKLVKDFFSIEILIFSLSLGVSGLIWLYLLKKIEFNILYPMISVSYIFGMLVSIIVFKETVPLIRWIGVLVIIIGIFLITRN